MRVLVTGGAGFLGSHLCDRLIAAGHDVICLDDLSTGHARNLAHLVDHPRFTFQRHDVIEPYAIDAAQIYHLACPASPVQYRKDPVRTIRTCVDGTRHALDCARASGARLLIASTSEVYGDPGVHPQHEGYWGHVNPIGPRSCYDEGKRCAEALAVAYAATGVDVRIARIFNTYGPRMAEHDGRAVSTFIADALRGAPLAVHGSGAQTRSFCYVDDLLDAIARWMTLDGAGPGPMNLGNPAELSILALAELIRELVGSPSPIEHVPAAGDDPARRRPDITRARDLLGWQPSVTLRDGLARTIAAVRSTNNGT